MPDQGVSPFLAVALAPVAAVGISAVNLAMSDRPLHAARRTETPELQDFARPVRRKDQIPDPPLDDFEISSTNPLTKYGTIHNE